MKKLTDRKISLLQFILTISGIEVGSSILSLPADLARVTGTDGWISIIIGYLFTILISLCIIGIMSKHPNNTMLDVLIYYLGSFFGKSIMVVWILYSLLGAVTIFYTSIYIIKEWVLPNTMTFLIVALFLLCTYIALRGGVRLICRYQVFVFFFTLWMPLILLFSLKHGHLTFLLPVLKEGWLPILHGVKVTVLAFLGFEWVFLFYPYLENKKHAVKGIIIANTITLLVYLQITFSCFTFFSPDEISKFIWPTLTLVKPVRFSFLERFEIIYLSFYIFIFSTSVIPYFFFAMENIAHLFHKPDWHVPYVILLAYALSYLFYQPSYTEITFWKDSWQWMGYFLVYLFPLLFLLYTMLVGRWRGRQLNEKTG
ncbi:GerAB/ArcD/ProY family transporter [Brevibacillus laterosporus]|uniref:Spore gernimation protein n=1 Tax=Brevibacillus laterosporus TaxID=1465 RepID=A0AAP8QEG4_BRELA|nr:endospore germination permease [Brevibacillus laterosporus]PPB08494.1 spore gernimation protein [Brevibacillus laterosporus]